MEVHPPDHPVMTWKQFFVHMAIVILGLLIAIGLEQTVELLHHRHQRHELQQALREDCEKVISDTYGVEAAARARVDWDVVRIAQARAALHQHAALAFLPPNQAKVPYHNFPELPAWQAAKADNLIEVLPQEDSRTYYELGLLIDGVEKAYLEGQLNVQNRVAFEQRFRTNRDASSEDFSSITQAELEQYLGLLYIEEVTYYHVYSGALMIRAATEATVHGERSLDKINDAERQGEREARAVLGN